MQAGGIPGLGLNKGGMMSMGKGGMHGVHNGGVHGMGGGMGGGGGMNSMATMGGFMMGGGMSSMAAMGGGGHSSTAANPFGGSGIVRVHESCHACICTWMSHVTHVDVLLVHTCRRISLLAVAFMWMSHVTHLCVYG